MVYILIAAVICGADQLLKHWIVTHLSLGSSTEFIPGVLGFTHVRNTGMAFSLLSEHTWLLALVSVAVIAVIAVLLFKAKFTTWEKIYLALIMGGAAGNAIDRVFLGYVVDMFETLFVRFAVFNLADAFIDVGAVLFCILYVTRTVREEKAKKAGEGERIESDRDRQ